LAGYSPRPLAAKLGIKPGHEVCPVGEPENYLELLAAIPEDVRFVTEASPNTHIIHFFSREKSELAAALEHYRHLIHPAAAVWVSWPKKASKVPTDITEDTIRELALPLGFVDIKVCAVDEVWSGLKLVIRKELR